MLNIIKIMVKNNKNENKIIKTNKIIKNNFISATSIKNFILNDPLIDWLKYYKINDITDAPDINRLQNKYEDKFLSYILTEGIKFEKYIIEQLALKFDIVTVCNENDYTNFNKFEETKQLLLKGIPIIYQGLLYNYKNNTYGIPDLLIRSDYINKIYENTIPLNEELINGKFYYFVVDIKGSTINLDSTGINVLNSNNLSFYKSQLLIYTLAVSEILNITINKAFILGKRYIWTNNNNKNIATDPFLKLGTIDYENKDFKYYNLIEKGLVWLNDVKEDGHNWHILPTPSRKELYPNMKNSRYNNYSLVKNQLAYEIKELTSIWYVNYKNRNFAHSNNIYSWTDKKCNSTTLGINNKRGIIIDNILNVNRDSDKIIYPLQIKYNENNWKQYNNNTMEFYIDYETTNYENRTYIFMIGVGYIDNGWKFKNFTMPLLDDETQELVLKDFWIFINNLLLKCNKTEPRFIHWTKAEPSNYNKYIDKFKLPNMNFIDLYDVFVKEPITIKGALNFSLKEISKAMYNLKLIQTTWQTDISCMNGLDTLYWSLILYKTGRRIRKTNKYLNDIIKYNEIDCKVLYEIITYLRNNHIL